jgi:hypothetical protein
MSKIFNSLKVVASICGGWWATMSGAASIPFAFASLFLQGSEKKLFAILAYVSLWVFSIGVVIKNRSIAESKNKTQKDALRIAVSKLRTKLEAMNIKKVNKNSYDGIDFENIVIFIRESIQELSPVVASLEPFVNDRDSLHKLWLEYESQYKKSDEFTAFNLEVDESHSFHNAGNPPFDPVKRISEYLEKFDSYGK